MSRSVFCIMVITISCALLCAQAALAADVDQLLRMEQYRAGAQPAQPTQPAQPAQPVQPALPEQPALAAAIALPAVLPGMARTLQQLAQWIALYPQPAADSVYAYG